MNKTRVAVKAVIVCNGCFLLLERRQNGEEGIYDLPGGGVETGESHTQALTREIFEETGLTVRIKRPLRTWSFSPRAGETLYGVTFLAEYLSGTLTYSITGQLNAQLEYVYGIRHNPGGTTRHDTRLQTALTFAF